jgi:hypothetical protein
MAVSIWSNTLRSMLLKEPSIWNHKVMSNVEGVLLAIPQKLDE